MLSVYVVLTFNSAVAIPVIVVCWLYVNIASRTIIITPMAIFSLFVLVVKNNQYHLFSEMFFWYVYFCAVAEFCCCFFVVSFYVFD